ncbi:hypothetical protein BofuT4_uP063980.1 [Botrytis cinerea T4]|uniref:Uncharacterized protein n=1 Tax=Botryotinia fuckeliana (strain T4) TaxID=999810 RepID=G2XSS8_BOTF4|nr:hypothetical protein BofuT4_uP063980.1 [Botrytis cinerea T4]
MRKSRFLSFGWLLEAPTNVAPPIIVAVTVHVGANKVSSPRTKQSDESNSSNYSGKASRNLFPDNEHGRRM